MKTHISCAVKLISTLFLSVFLICSNSHSFQNEPDGFSGIKWGGDIKSMKYRFMQREVQGGLFAGEKEIRAYVKFNDNKTLGPVALEEIYYYFWNDIFIGVEIVTNGSSNVASIKKFCFKKYGSNIEDSQRMNNNFNVYTWKGDVAGISLFDYDDRKGFEQGLLRIYSQKMIKQITSDKVKKQKAESATDW